MFETTRRLFVGIVLGYAILPIAQTRISNQETPVGPLKVLFIGNSYTSVNNLPAMVVRLAEASGGRKIEVGRHLVGGCTLEKHVKDQKAIDRIRAKRWDVVVLQEQSLRPVVSRQSMHDYARLLDTEIKQQGAMTVFYLTWARQHIPEMQEGADPVKSPEYAKAMYGVSGSAKATDLETWCEQQKAGLVGGLNGAYVDIAKELSARVAPVGMAWKKALAADPHLVLHRSDKSHPNPAGTYLAACVFYANLLNTNPIGMPGEIRQGDKVLVSISSDAAERLQKTAWESAKGIVGKKPSDSAAYTNTVGVTPIHMSDPFVIQHERMYHLFGTNTSNEGFRCLVSSDWCIGGRRDGRVVKQRIPGQSRTIGLPRSISVEASST